MAPTWTAIGLLAAAALASPFYLGSRIDALAGRMDSRFDAIETRLDAINARIDAHLHAG